MAELLQVRNVSKNFGGLQALSDVNLEVRQNEIVALIGPNGAGKTTLFATIAGFLKPDTGAIAFAGHDIVGRSPDRICELGMVRTFQIVQPFAGLTVRQNIAVGAHLRHARRGEALALADAVGRRLGMGHLLDRQAVGLTVAARKRLELARALATEPRLLLLDEVMAGLNPTEIDEIVAMIGAIRDDGLTVLLIEHVMQAVMSLAERIYVLNNGALIADGTPADIAANASVVDAYLGHGAASRLQDRQARHA